MANDGSAVGVVDGVTEVKKIGCSLGAIVGSILGASVGEMVGNNVGAFKG